MKLSSIGKKIMAVALASAMTLTGLAVPSAKTAKAASEPTVKFLGATLRTTGNETGKQSLRVGIEVANASSASNCGIKIKVKGNEKETVVSTENAEYQKVYSKDDDADKIVYSVVVQNIPVAQATTEIEFVGFVNKLETPSEISAQTDAVSKSVSGVVQSMSNSLDKDVILLESGDYAGTLVYEYARLDMSAARSNLDMPDKTGDYSAGKFVVGKNDKRAQCEYVDLGEGAPYYKVITPEAGEGTENTQGKGLGYIHPSMAKTDSYIFSAEVKADTGVALNLTTFWGWNTWREAGHGGKAVDCNGEWKKIEFKTADQESWDGSNYFSTAATGAKEYCIKNVVIYKVLSDADMPEIAAPPTGWNADHTEYTLKLDSSSITVANPWAGNAEFTFNQDGSVLVSKRNLEFGIVLPEEIYKANKFEKAIITYAGSQGGVGYVVKYDNGSPNWAEGEEAHYGPQLFDSTSGTSTVTPNDKDKHMSAIRIFSDANHNSLIIKSIVFVKAQ